MIRCGWLEGQRAALEEFAPDLELGIASWGYVPHGPMIRGNSTYFSLVGHRPQGRLASLRANWRHQSVPEEALDEAVSIARRFAPDLVHVHGTENSLGLAGLRLPQPCVATLQGLASVYQHFVLPPLGGRELLCGTVSREFLRGRGLMHAYWDMKRRAAVEREVIGRLQYFMGHNEWDRTVLKLMNPSAEYFRCGHAVQSCYYDAEWTQPLGLPLTVFCTSSSGSYKGVETLIEALGLLHEAGHREVRLRIAGDILGSPMGRVAARLVDHFSLEHSVCWLGPLRASDVAVELSKATLYVLPSHIENEPNSLLEAMLVGVPCVAAAVGGVPWIVRDGVDGLLYHDSDPFSLAGTMLRIIKDAQLARSLGSEARVRARERCDPETVARQTMAVYERIAGGV